VRQSDPPSCPDRPMYVVEHAAYSGSSRIQIMRLFFMTESGS